MKRFSIIGLCLAVVMVLSLTFGCAPQPAQEPELSGALHIFHAGSLTIPFEEVTEGFNQLYPDVEVLAEGAGSATTIRKFTELQRECGVIGSADYTLIPQLMFPDYADWYIIFATNQMVIAYTEKAKYQDEINADNWHEILLRGGVEYGHSDPNADPCGYRTLMVWQLAEIYYGVPGLYQQLDEACPEKNVRPKEVDLIALLEAGALDYAFEYRSVAMQHDLKYLSLPEELDLSNFELADSYAQAEVEVSGAEPGTTTTLIGAPIAYGVTIPKDAPHPELAISFLQFLLSPEGQGIMADCGQPPIVPAIASNFDRLPEELKEFVSP